MAEITITEREFSELDPHELKLLTYYRILRERGEKLVTVRDTVRDTGISVNKVLKCRKVLADKGYIENNLYVRGTEISLKQTAEQEHAEFLRDKQIGGFTLVMAQRPDGT